VAGGTAFRTMERGAISPLRALIIAPVLSGAHETAWLARAHEVTVKAPQR